VTLLGGMFCQLDAFHQLRNTAVGHDLLHVWKRNENHQIGTRFVVHQRFVSAVSSVEPVSGGVSYVDLRGCWCDVTCIVLL
jgi:hypothetical protein